MLGWLTIPRTIMIIAFVFGIPMSLNSLGFKITKLVGQEMNCGIGSASDAMDAINNIQMRDYATNNDTFEKITPNLEKCIKEINPNIGTYKFFRETIPTINKNIKRLNDMHQ
ncbi:hypothetical protein [Citrobacter koseri]|uniref:hypothetical protein n=1 Tax=Citrobacter koseri TaxID=545 RepID=UPI0038911E02